MIFCCETSDEGGISRQKLDRNDKEACVRTSILRIRAKLASSPS